ncbi:hypothetical protein GIB67_013966 [Kingdonia uniflora]|uniref:Uncharacterized protein n=1 Tax=Kingdonia uniflora TaxID=39325 RepID=A0A7J7LDG9_9MAGN|nr:hypothetical protein GIB67_013966 [Kingdonia uniflora]
MRSRNQIHCIYDENGHKTDDAQEIGDKVEEYLKEIFGAEHEFDYDKEVLEIVQMSAVLDEIDHDFLGEYVTSVEITHALALLGMTILARLFYGTQTLGMYYAKLRSSWEELSHYDSFIKWPASAPRLNPDFEYTRVHLQDKTPFPTLEEAHAYCLSNQSRRSPMPPISGIPSETSAMAVRYAYSTPPSVPLQTSHTSSPSLSQLLAASGNSRPSRKKCDYCDKWGHLKTTCHALHGRPAGYQPRPSQSSTHLSADSSVPDSSAFSALSQDKINRFRQLLSVFHTGSFSCSSRPLQVYTRRHPGRQPPIPDCQAFSVAPGLPPAIDSPLSGIEPSPTASILVTN